MNRFVSNTINKSDFTDIKNIPGLKFDLGAAVLSDRWFTIKIGSDNIRVRGVDIPNMNGKTSIQTTYSEVRQNGDAQVYVFPAEGGSSTQAMWISIDRSAENIAAFERHFKHDF